MTVRWKELNTKQLRLNITASLFNRIAREAKKRHRSRNELIRRLLVKELFEKPPVIRCGTSCSSEYVRKKYGMPPYDKKSLAQCIKTEKENEQTELAEAANG